jgi:hypothetical protein
MAAEIQRVVIGLEGSQLLELRVTDDVYTDLRKALEDDNAQRWHVVPSQDNEVLVDLAKVVYVSRASQEHRVGF